MDESPYAPMKFCGGCNQWFPREKFSCNARNKDGLQTRCKDCNKHYVEQHKEEIQTKKRQYYLDHREDRLLQLKQHYHLHQEEMRERERLYRATHKDIMYRIEKRKREKHKDAIRERQKRWQQSDAYKTYQRRYQQKNRAKIKEQRRQYYLANRERLLAEKRAYGKTARGRLSYLLNTHRRRAYKRSLSGRYTSQQIHQQIERQKNRCYYCRAKLGEKRHIEHVVPLSRGGSNDISNIVISCPTCNLKKGAKLPHEWPEGGRLL